MNSNIFLVVAVVAMGGLIFGFDIGGAGGTFVMDGFRNQFGWPLDKDSVVIDKDGKAVLYQDADSYPAGGSVTWEEVKTSANAPEYKNYEDIKHGEGKADHGNAYGVFKKTFEDKVASEQGLIASMFSVGALLGGITGGTLADAIGRKKALLISSFVFTIGATVQACSFGLTQLLIGRVVGGYGVGTLSLLVSLYNTEIAPQSIRGRCVSLFQLAITFGILLAAIANIGLKYTEWGWRISYGGNAIISAIMFCALFFVPETPQWYVMKGQSENARQAMTKVRDQEEIEGELRLLSENEEKRRLEGKGSWLDLVSTQDNMWYKTVLGVSSQFWQQFSGINAIMFFAPEIFNKLMSDTGALWANLAVMAVNFLSTFVAVKYVDQLGRRKLLIWGGIAMGVACAAISGMSSSVVVDDPNEVPSVGIGVGIIIFTAIYVFGFASSWGPVPWTLCGEIFPQRSRAKAMSITTATNWGCAAIVGQVVPIFLKPEVFNLWGTFLFFAIVCALMVIWMYFLLPETKGAALEDIDALFTAHRLGKKQAKMEEVVEGKDVEHFDHSAPEEAAGAPTPAYYAQPEPQYPVLESQ